MTSTAAILCGVCGARMPLTAHSQIASFDASHDETCGPDASIQITGDWQSLP